MKKTPRINYNPETGVITKGGQPVQMYHHRGRPAIRLIMATGDGATIRKTFQATRVAWALHYKVVPKADEVIVFKDGDCTNLRIDNLQLVPKAKRGQFSLNRTNKTGFNGVWKAGKKYRAQFPFGGKRHFTSAYTTPEEAYRVAQEKRAGLTVSKSDTV